MKINETFDSLRGNGNQDRLNYDKTESPSELTTKLLSHTELNNGSDSLSDSVLSFFKDQIKKYSNAPKVA